MRILPPFFLIFCICSSSQILNGLNIEDLLNQPHAEGPENPEQSLDQLLEEAIQHDNIEELENIINEEGISYNYQFNNFQHRDETLLHSAIRHNSNTISEFLLDQDVDISLVEAGGDNALLYAVYFHRFNNNKRIIECLFDKGASIASFNTLSGMTSLHYAVEDSPALVSLLLDHGASATTNNYDYERPLKIAAENEYYKIIDLLIDK